MEYNKEKHRISQAKWNAKNRERIISYKKKWSELNHEKVIKYQKNYRLRRKAKALGGYGKKCVCCGEDNIGFLTLDHVGGNGHGSQHRKTVKGSTMYQWVIQNKHPAGFQVLCFNCNAGRAVRGNICPHKEDKMTIDEIIDAGI